jgi:hypothetical protein
MAGSAVPMEDYFNILVFAPQVCSLLFFLKKKVTKNSSQIEILFVIVPVPLAIWHWEIQPRPDYLELKLSANFGNPGRWFFRRRGMFEMKHSFRRKKGGARFI